MNPHPETSPGDAAGEAVRALPPAAPLDPAFSRRVLRAAQSELTGSQSAYQRTERLFARVLVPLALVACAAGWSYHVAHIAERVYLSQGR